MFEVVFEILFKPLFSEKKEIVAKTTEKNKQRKPIRIPELFKRNSSLILSFKKNSSASIPKTYNYFKNSVNGLNDKEEYWDGRVN